MKDSGGYAGATHRTRELGKNDIKRVSLIAINTFALFWTATLLITVFGLIFWNSLLIPIYSWREDELNDDKVEIQQVWLQNLKNNRI